MMASAQVDLDLDMKNMVLCFRVSELQVLLGHAGRNKSGRKHELMNRALQLVRSSSCNKAIQAKIIDLYSQRYPHNPSRMKTPFSSPPKIENHVGRSLALPVPHKQLHQDSDQTKYPDAKIKLKLLPFCELMAVIRQPTILPTKSNRSTHDFMCKFKLDAEQAREIRMGTVDGSKRQVQYEVQVQLRFCFFDTSSAQEDALPPNLFVKVNRNTVPLPAIIPPNKSGVEAKRPNRPIDITSLCRLTNYADQTLEIRWTTDANKPHNQHAVTINLIRQLTVDDLLLKLEQGGVAQSSVSRSLIQKKLAKDPESDISTTSLKVSLLCPLGKMRMKLPTRPKTCTHLQCFDASLFLMMNEKRPTWTCPVCDKRALFSTLAIDGLFMEILNNCKSDEIEFTDDGNWHCSEKKTETFVIGTPMKPIDLSQSGNKTTQKEKKSTQPDVIDLTGDSSDDEPICSPPAKSPAAWLSDGTSMSISCSPCQVGSPNSKLNRLDALSTNYSSRHSNSPHSRTSSKPRMSPSRSPLYRSDSPYYYPHRHYTPISYHSKSPKSVSHSTPPLGYPVVSSHSSPYSINGVVDVPPTAVSSTLVTSTFSPTASDSLPSMSPLGLGINGYSASPLSLVASLSDPASYRYQPNTPFNELFSQRAYFDSFPSHPQIPSLYMPNPFLHQYDLYTRSLQNSAPSSDSRTLSSQQQRLQDNDTNFNQDAIPID